MAAPASALKAEPRRMTLWESFSDVDQLGKKLFALDDLLMDGIQVSDAEYEKKLLDVINAVHGNKEKIDRTASMFAALDSAEQHAVAEAERYSRRAQAMKRRRDLLEKTVLQVLETFRLDKAEGNVAELVRRKNPPKVLIDDESQIPGAYLRFPEPPPPPPAVPDKALIKAALKSDPKRVPGARLVTAYRLEVL